MLSLLIVLASIYLVGREPLHRFLSEHYKDILEGRENLIKYLGGGVVFAATVSILPGLLMHRYMVEHQFFAYEVFQSDEGAFRILSLDAWATVILLSATLFGSIPAFWAKADKAGRWFMLFVNCAAFLLSLALAAKSGKVLFFFAACITPLTIAIYAGFLIGTSPATKAKHWYFPWIISGLLVAPAILLPTQTAGFTSSLLSLLNIGGHAVLIRGEPMLIGSTNGEKKYFLLLRTNDNLYVKPIDDQVGSTTTILRLESYSLTRSD